MSESVAPCTAFWSGLAARLMACGTAEVVAGLAVQQIRHFRTAEADLLPAWTESLETLKAALGKVAGATAWHVLLEFPLLRLGRRIDAVLLTPRAILVLEFKREQADAAARRQVEDYALDLFDFHAGSRAHPVVPVLVSGGVPEGLPAMPLLWGVATVLAVRPGHLGELLAEIAARVPCPAMALDPLAWLVAPYRPVPTIVEAACMAYARNGVAELAAARADRRNLRETVAAIWAAIAAARAEGGKAVLFVTGIPGAGKTLCGLNAAFAPEDALRGTFLTGNPTLVHVLREALVRDAVRWGRQRRAMVRHMETVIQRLPDFRTHYLEHADHAPAEPVVVIDEAQRCWSRDYAVRKTRDKRIRLSDSEPGHLLDIVGRRADFSVLVCMVGGGQEIHDGEGGLAEWGMALRARPEWRVMAPPDVVSRDERQSLGAVPGMTIDPVLHLDVPVRQVRGTNAARWVDAVLRSDADEAAEIAAECALPFAVTRSVAAMRRALRAEARGTRQAGLLASSAAARLRPEGLGVEVPHMDAAAVAHWFLDRFPPDVRASDALEAVATEFCAQGLELDYVGLAWDGDLIRDGAHGWLARRFGGSAWQVVRSAERVANAINTYRVLLTRARYRTIIYVPRGDEADRTRTPAMYDAVASFLRACGAAELNEPAFVERFAKPVLL